MLAAQLVPDLSAIFSHFLAEAILCLAIPVMILADLFAGTGERRERVAGVIGMSALILAFFVALCQPAHPGAMLTGLLRADGIAKAFRLLAIGTGALAAVAAHRQRDVTRGRTEFFTLLIGAVAGACLTAAANNLAMLYLAVETLSICGYLLAGFKRDDPKGSEAALKYMIFGAVSSGAMLYGMSLLYGFAGTATIATPPGADFASLQGVAGTASASPGFLVAIVLVFAGLAYKVAAAPFQFWCPDVYQGSPTSVAAFLAVASKGAGLAALLRIVAAVSGGGLPMLPDEMPQALVTNNDAVRLVLLGIAVLTSTWGNLAALRQQDAKRLLAYSAIAHAGVLLMGVAVLNSAGATAVIFYMFVYLFMTLCAFYIVGMVERETNRTDLDAFEGLGFSAPLLAACMAICLVSLTGLPPTAGFVAKFQIFREVFAYAGRESTNYSNLFFWGGVIVLLNTVVSLAFYARILKRMYMADLDRIQPLSVSLAGIDKGLILALTVPVLVLGVAFGGLWDLALGLAQGIF